VAPNGNWAGYSYEWSDDGTDAYLLEGVKLKWVGDDVLWTYPGQSQCASCHTAAAGFALGPEVAQLNRDLFYSETGRVANQLETWTAIGLFGESPPDDPEFEPALALYEDSSASIDERARSYLHANCSGCHREDGLSPASIDLHYATPFADMRLCRTPAHRRVKDLVRPLDPPAESPLSQAMQATGAIRMPPIGSQIVDPVGTALIDDWIGEITECVPEPASRLLGVAALVVLLALRCRSRASRVSAAESVARAKGRL